MLGVKYDASALAFRIDEDSPLTFYDADFNDPPLELKGEVEDWLAANTPDATIDYRDAFDIWIVFKEERSAILFKTFWL